VTVDSLSPRAISAPRMSPDGRYVAYAGRRPGTSSDEGLWHLYVYERATGGQPRQLTREEPVDYGRPVWSPDGARVAYSWVRDGAADIMVQDPVGVEPARRVATLAGSPSPSDWNDRGLLLSSGSSVHELRLGGSSGVDSVEARVLFEEPGTFVARPRSDPAGEWVVYQAQEGTGVGIYVRRAPDFLTRQRVVEGDEFYNPWWSADGDSIYVQHFDGDLYVLPVRRGTGLSFGSPRRLFPGFMWLSPFTDGSGFVAVASVESDEEDGVPERHFLVVGWFDELRRRTGG